MNPRFETRRLDGELMEVKYGVSAAKVQEHGKHFTFLWKDCFAHLDCSKIIEA